MDKFWWASVCIQNKYTETTVEEIDILGHNDDGTISIETSNGAIYTVTWKDLFSTRAEAIEHVCLLLLRDSVNGES